MAMFFGLGAIFIAAPGYGLKSVSNTYRELIPTRTPSTDEERPMAFYLGPLIFHIKNKFLVFPFANGRHPFDASICGRRNLSDFERKFCDNSKRSVFLRIPVQADRTEGPENPFISAVTLGYQQKYLFDEHAVDDFAAEVNWWEHGRERAPELDTKEYAAVRVLPNSHFFIAKGTQSPHVISCSGSSNEKDYPQKVICTGRSGFLADEFPRKGGQYPFTLEYEFPGAELDHAPEVEIAVTKAVATFPHSLAP